MSNREKELALIVWSAYAADLKTRIEALRAELCQDMAETERRPVVVGGVTVGSVTKSASGKPQPVARIADQEEFMAWVEATAPHRIVSVVDPQYVSDVLGMAAATGGSVNAVTGEVSPVPGVVVSEVPGSVSRVIVPRTKDDAREWIDSVVAQMHSRLLSSVPAEVES